MKIVFALALSCAVLAVVKSEGMEHMKTVKLPEDMLIEHQLRSEEAMEEPSMQPDQMERRGGHGGGGGGKGGKGGESQQQGWGSWGPPPMMAWGPPMHGGWGMGGGMGGYGGGMGMGGMGMGGYGR